MYRGDRSAQGDAGRLRLPPALGARQPAAQVRGVGAARRQVIFVSRHAGRLRAGSTRAWSSSRSSARPGLLDPVIEVRPIGARSTTCSRDQGCAERGARAGHDADQAHGRGSDRVLRRELGVRVRYLHSTSTRSSASRSSATCGAASSTCWSASTCCARASTCPRSALVAILDADKEGFLRSERSPDPDHRARRPQRGPVARDLDRAEDDVAQSALDRRHGHRDLRLPAPAVCARRRAALPRYAGAR
jgi:excinuclease ABC subunit B